MLHSDLQHAATERPHNTQCYTLEMHTYKVELTNVGGGTRSQVPLHSSVSQVQLTCTVIKIATGCKTAPKTLTAIWRLRHHDGHQAHIPSSSS